MKRLKQLVLGVGLLAVLAALAAMAAIDRAQIPPRNLSPYIEHRAEGHNERIVSVGNWAGETLLRMDRGGAPIMVAEQRLNVGAHEGRAAQAAQGGQTHVVDSAAALITAINTAQAGDRILIAPGTYYVRGDGGYLRTANPGREGMPIVVNAEQAGTVTLEFDMGEGFLVTMPHWTFENLVIKGVCKVQEFCEHAFHVVGGAHHFVSRNNAIIDFNAHYKINGEGGQMPDVGTIDHNSLYNRTVRQTANPVTLIDLVAASRWSIHDNYLGDFIKGGGDRISYGGFAKGAGRENVFERNVVLCENHLSGQPGARVGLSLGGGGTGLPFCRDKRCITEQDASRLTANLIAACSDDGIYVNRAATSVVTHNTLIDTGGISVRFVESSADVQGNLVDGMIRARDGGILRAADNVDTSALRLYLGMHPVRDYFRNIGDLDLNWVSAGPGASVYGRYSDLCGNTNASLRGAFDSFAGCVR